MAPPKANRKCSVDGCNRKHAAHGFCLMHYKRFKKHGSPDYKWAGKVVGRPCLYCDRPAVARDMCYRHYQMWRNHGDPEYSDKLKKHGVKNGEHIRKGYLVITKVASFPNAEPAGPSVEKSHRHHTKGVIANGYRKGGGRTLEHRLVAGANPGEIVHHIDGDKLNNSLNNLMVFPNNSEHTKAHKTLEGIGYILFKHGLIHFDRHSGAYSLDESFLKSILQPE